MTEEQQGGNAPTTEATADVTPPAPEESTAAIAVADEPVADEPTADASSEPTADAQAQADAPSAEASAAGAASAEAVGRRS